MRYLLAIALALGLTGCPAPWELVERCETYCPEGASALHTSTFGDSVVCTCADGGTVRLYE